MPRRILLLITDLEIGGTPTVVRELATRLHAPPDVEVEVACLARWGPIADEIRAAGVTVTALGATRSWELPLLVRRLRRIIAARSIDTVFSFLLHANVVGALASRRLRGVRFLQSIQTTQPNPRWHWRLQRHIWKYADAVVVPSDSVADAAAKWSRVPPERIVVIPNAIDADKFLPSPVPPTDARPYPIGFIGRLDPVKRVDKLIAAVAEVDKLHPNLVHLHIFGDGAERWTLESISRQFVREDLVTFHGAVASPQEALRQVGLVVLPSEAEGFGLVLIEAMAASVPVIGTNVTGIRDVIRHDENGLLVGQAGAATLLSAIITMIQQPSLRRRLAANGWRDVRERFSWKRVLPQYRQLLRVPGS